MVTGANCTYGRVVSSRTSPTRRAQPRNATTYDSGYACGRQTNVTNEWEWTHNAYEDSEACARPPSLLGMLKMHIVRCHEFRLSAMHCTKFNGAKTLLKGS